MLRDEYQHPPRSLKLVEKTAPKQGERSRGLWACFFIRKRPIVHNRNRSQSFNVVATSHLTFFFCNQNLNLPVTNLFFNFLPFLIVITTPFIFIDKDGVVEAVLGTRHQTTAQFEWRWDTVVWFVTWQTQGDKEAEYLFWYWYWYCFKTL